MLGTGQNGSLYLANQIIMANDDFGASDDAGDSGASGTPLQKLLKA